MGEPTLRDIAQSAEFVHRLKGMNEADAAHELAWLIAKVRDAGHGVFYIRKLADGPEAKIALHAHNGVSSVLPCPPELVNYPDTAHQAMVEALAGLSESTEHDK
jgi:hypothetical protein